eukprot:m.78066 g.78066  ORF g.78066 m.78066 type:complete len:544 (+) comp12654_c0_seq5:101-1732(+)
MEEDGGLSLLQILQTRESPLQEKELWALCHFSAASLHQEMQREMDSVDTNCNPQDAPCALVCPSSLTINKYGKVKFIPCFDAKNFSEFLPPDTRLTVKEIYNVSADKVHTYALAATLYFAADFGLSEEEEPGITEDLEIVMSSMADESEEERLTLQFVIDLTLDGLTVSIGTQNPLAGTEILKDLYETSQKILLAKKAKDTTRGGKNLLTPNVSVGRALLDELQRGVTLKKVPQEIQQQTAVTSLSTWDMLMMEVKKPPPLKNSTERSYANSFDKHIPRIAPNPSYVTPHDALLRDIIAFPSNKELRHVQVAPRSEHNVHNSKMATPNRNFEVSKKDERPSEEGPDSSKDTEFKHSSQVGGRVQLAPPASITVMLESWDPTQQVHLGFAAANIEQDYPVSTSTPAAKNGGKLVLEIPEFSELNSNLEDPIQADGTLQQLQEKSKSANQEMLSLEDFKHIRKSFVKAEIEDLRDANQDIGDAVASRKRCRGCRKLFGIFLRRHVCCMCELATCSNCLPKHCPTIFGEGMDICRSCMKYMGGAMT